MKRTASLGLLFAAFFVHANANACVPSYNTRCNVDMGLDLIDGVEDFSYHYTFNGAGVDIYIVDSGFGNAASPTAQAEFGNRYTVAADFTSPANNSGSHGVNMAMAAGGATLGAASGANIRQVRVNVGPSDPTNASLKQALTWLRDEKILLDEYGETATTLRRQSVVSISLTRGYDPTVNALIGELVDRGLAVFVSAGNDGLDASGFSPASEAKAFTVSAGDVNYGRQYWANYGSVVDGFVYAANTPFGGTSQATARAAGVAALIWQQYSNLTGTQVVEEMERRAQVNAMPLDPTDLSRNLVVTSVPLARNPSFFGISNKCGNRNSLQWIDAGPDILYFELQKSANPQFSQPVTEYTGLTQGHTVYVSSPTYYRVRGCNYRGCNTSFTNANRPAIPSPACP